MGHIILAHTRISTTYQQQKELGRVLSPDQIIEYGGEMPNGYSCDGELSVGQFEKCFISLMGEDFVFEDFKKFESIHNQDNIIYPVLDVLYKAAHKLKTDDVRVDAVILNGGMSQLYLIENRLERFFGFHPIGVSDPDKSVAQGASVYHFYTRNNPGLYAKHQTFMQSAAEEKKPMQFKDYTAAIRTVGSILNESLYLGMKGGSVQLLAETGQELPYLSDTMSGFCINAGQAYLSIPIKQRDKGSSFKTIAHGCIKLPQAPQKDMPVEIRFSLNRSQMMDFEVWNGNKQIGRMDIVLGEDIADAVIKKRGKMLVPPDGAMLVASNEVSSLEQLVKQSASCKKHMKKGITDRINQKKKSIAACGNPADFSKPMLQMLNRCNGKTETLHILIPIARKLSYYWTVEERDALGQFCLNNLGRALMGLEWGGIETNANIELIHTVGVCGSSQLCEKLIPLVEKPRYRSALLWAFGNAGIMQEWIYEQLIDDYQRNLSFQASMRALGLSIYNDSHGVDQMNISEVASFCLDIVDSGSVSNNELNIAVVTIGLLCAKKHVMVSESICEKAHKLLTQLPLIYTAETAKYAEKSTRIAKSLLENVSLGTEDEQYLLSLLNTD